MVLFVFSLQTVSGNQNISLEDLKKSIDFKIKTIESNPELLRTIDLEKVSFVLSENLEKKEELIRINKELEMIIGRNTGTICIT